jgi:hypothetical protein
MLRTVNGRRGKGGGIKCLEENLRVLKISGPFLGSDGIASDSFFLPAITKAFRSVDMTPGMLYIVRVFDSEHLCREVMEFTETAHASGADDSYRFCFVEDDEEKVMVVRTIVAVAFLVMCMVVMHKVFWMLEQCVPRNQEAAAKARARRWKGAVAAVVVSAWICAICIALGFDMPKAMCAVMFAGPGAITIPVLVWVFLIY